MGCSHGIFLNLDGKDFSGDVGEIKADHAWNAKDVVLHVFQHTEVDHDHFALELDRHRVYGGKSYVVVSCSYNRWPCFFGHEMFLVLEELV